MITIKERVFGSKESCNAIALAHQGNVVTYKELLQRISFISSLIKDKLCSEGDNVIIYLPNCIFFVSAFFGILDAGAVAVLVDTNLKAELIDIFNDLNPRLILTDELGYKKIIQTCNNAHKDYNILTENELVDFRYFGNLSLNPTEITDRPKKPIKKLATIMYTSGSEGRPKGVWNTHQTLINALDNYVSTVHLNSQDRLLSVTPFFHSYAFGSNMLAGLSVGATLFLQTHFQPRTILEIIERDSITIFHGVPYMYDLMVQQFETNSYDLRSIRMLISAGARIRHETLLSFYDKTGCVVHQEYGSTETGTIAINLSDNVKNNCMSVGKPLNNVTIRIIHDAVGETEGTILVKSSGRAGGYYNGACFDAEWYETGDIGYMDDEGYLIITGRKKRMINVGGLKVNPVHVEDVIKGIKGVRDVIVQPFSHLDFGEGVEAVIMKEIGVELTQEDILAHCRQHLALYKLPRRIIWEDEMNISALGKVKTRK